IVAIATSCNSNQTEFWNTLRLSLIAIATRMAQRLHQWGQQMKFCEKLRQLKDASGFSEAKLSQESGVRLGALHTYILGSRSPSFSAVVKLARALGVTCEAFADCDDIADEQPATRPAKPRSAASKPRRKKGE